MTMRIVQCALVPFAAYLTSPQSSTKLSQRSITFGPSITAEWHGRDASSLCNQGRVSVKTSRAVYQNSACNQTGASEQLEIWEKMSVMLKK